VAVIAAHEPGPRGIRYQDVCWNRIAVEETMPTILLAIAAVFFVLAQDRNDTRAVHVSGSAIVIADGHGNAYKMTTTQNGVMFDIDGDGRQEQVAWTDGSVAFLALDRNGNGQIDNGTELFGDHTLPPAPNGFAALARLADFADGKINRDHLKFAQLLLWYDRNHNGISEAGELVPASDKLEAIGLGYFTRPLPDSNQNRYRFGGWARTVVPGKTALHQTSQAEDYAAHSREFPIFEVWLEI
jgi:hypothetical protein